MLEGELESELNFSRTGVTIETTEASRRTLTEVWITGGVLKREVRGFEADEVHMVKEIEKLRSELHSVTFFNPPILVDRKVHVVT